MGELRIYLDSCVWCRPFDEQDENIRREVQALIEILRLRRSGKVRIISSSIVLAEVALISDPRKRESVVEFIQKSSDEIIGTDELLDVLELARDIKERCGLKPADAAHAALASKHADVFVTVDKGILRKSECLQKYIIVLDPVEFNDYYGRGGIQSS